MIRAHTQWLIVSIIVYFVSQPCSFIPWFSPDDYHSYLASTGQSYGRVEYGTVGTQRNNEAAHACMEDVSAIPERVDFQRQWGACTPHSLKHPLCPMHYFQNMSPRWSKYYCGEKNGGEKKKRYLYSSHRYIKAMGSWEMLIIWYCWLIRCHCTRI